MIVVQNRFEIAEGYEDEFVDRFANRQGDVEKWDGFRRFDLLRPAAAETNTFVSMTMWESMADFEAWTESKAFETGHETDAPPEMFESHPTLDPRGGYRANVGIGLNPIAAWRVGRPFRARSRGRR